MAEVKYILKRCIIGIVTMLVLITITFFLTRLMPGSPFQTGGTSQQVVASVEAEYGLDQPVAIQFITYVSKLFRGDFGISFQKPGVTVREVIGRALPVTFSIGIPAFLVAAVLGTFLGVCQATTNHPLVKRFLLFGFATCSGIPNFVTALLLSLIFGVVLGWLPIVGLTGIAHYILPVLSLSIYPTAVIGRMVYASSMEVMKQDYMRLARAKGMSKGTILGKHLLKNAILPAVAYMGPMTAYLLTGSFAVESIFTIPGLGREFVYSIGNRDYTLIMGLTIFMGMMVIAMGILSDIICKFLNPMIQDGRGGGNR
ncbi:MAG: ABC transporter permease [Lachnospiraceae bacterium]